MSDSEHPAGLALKSGNRVLVWGIAAIVAILLLAASVLFFYLPDANAFNARVERIFVENDALTTGDQIKLLEVLAQSGTAFSDVLVSYRTIIFVLLVFATALLIAALLFLVMILSLNRRMEAIQKQGIQVSSLIISRSENAVVLNDMEFKLTEAALETLSVLAEARMDDDILTGAQIESVISGKKESDCDEASGAMRIKRLRDTLGNQMVAELLVKNITRRGYMLSVRKDAIRMI